MRPLVIALTEPDDAHLEPVQNYLDDPIVVISPWSVVKGHDLTFEVSNDGRTRVEFQGRCLNNAKGVWYRKPEPYVADHLPMSDSFKVYTQDVQRGHYALLYTSLQEAIWVSDFYAIRRIDNKFMQLKLARECGFRIPKTLITSNKEKAEAFIQELGVCIVKSAANHFPVVDGKQTYFFAKKVYREAPPDLNGLHLAPSIFQQSIDVAYDVRVAVVGNKAFGSVITNEGLDVRDIRDWRIGHSEGTVHFEAHKLPKNIVDKCILFTKRAGLKFSAFDFVVDKKGLYWFIEDNPNGQWGFVEERTREAIAKAMANLLSGRTKE